MVLKSQGPEPPLQQWFCFTQQRPTDRRMSYLTNQNLASNKAMGYGQNSTLRRSFWTLGNNDRHFSSFYFIDQTTDLLIKKIINRLINNENNQ